MSKSFFKLASKLSKIKLLENSAQLLVEVLVAIAVGGVLVSAATAAIVSVMRQSYESRTIQNASLIGYDLMSSVRSYANSDWHNIYNLNHSSTSTYYIISSATSSLNVGLVGYWKFDEGSGSVSLDSSGQGNNATLFGSPTWKTSAYCQVGTSCLLFNGSAGYASSSDSSSLDIAGNLSVSLWVNWNTFKNTGVLIEKGPGNGTIAPINYALWSYAGNTIKGFIGNGSTYNEVSFSSASVLATSTWHLITFVVDGSYLNIYVDGIIRATSTQSITPAANNYSLYFSEPSYVLDGLIDDVRIYNRALSQDEVFKLYTNPPALGNSIAVLGQEGVLSNDVLAGLVAHWKFDEAGSNARVTYDATGNNNNGTLVNGVTRLGSNYCKISNCLSFNSALKTHVKVPNNSILNPSAISLSAWVYLPSAPTENGNIVSKGGNSGYRFRINNNLTVTWFDRGATNAITSISTVRLNAWQHIVVTGDSSGLKIYLNGVLDKSNTTPYGSPSTTYDLIIGSEGFAFYENFNGYIDDVRIYNRALLEDEVKQLYGSSAYTRYFYVSNVNRNANGDISSSGTDDPSTQNINAVVLHSNGAKIEFNQYITRVYKTGFFNQVNWSGGSGQDGPVLFETNYFSTSSNIVASNSLTLSSTSTSGNLVSSIIDTQSPLGSAINYIIWQGATNGGSVQFQLAYSNSLSGPWTYGGPSGSGSYYNGGPNTSIAVTNVNNYRYVRYKVILNPGGGNSPSVTGITLGWSF
jgi:hypothetical protein